MDSRQLAGKTPGSAARSTPSKYAAKRAAEHPMVQLQRLIGNQQVARMIAQRAEDEEEMVQAKADPGAEGGALSDGSSAQIQSARGQGSPLEPTLQAKMESGFGTSFADVRVHSDAQASDLNQSLSSKAFTTGSDIFLRGD